MLRITRIKLCFFIVIFLNPVLLHADEGLIVPKKGTVYYSLIEGLKLLAVGDIEEWINRSCDGIRLCSNSAEINHIRNYSAKVQKKIASSCLKNGGKSLHVDHVVGNPEIDMAVKIYLICDEKGPPRFYSLRRTMDFWFFISL